MKLIDSYRRHMAVHGTAPLWFSMPVCALLLAGLIWLLVRAA